MKPKKFLIVGGGVACCEAARELEFEVPEIHLLGDAKKVSNIMYAIWDAFEEANHI